MKGYIIILHDCTLDEHKVFLDKEVAENKLKELLDIDKFYYEYSSVEEVEII